MYYFQAKQPVGQCKISGQYIFCFNYHMVTKNNPCQPCDMAQKLCRLYENLTQIVLVVAWVMAGSVKISDKAAFSQVRASAAP